MIKYSTVSEKNEVCRVWIQYHHWCAQKDCVLRLGDVCSLKTAGRSGGHWCGNASGKAVRRGRDWEGDSFSLYNSLFLLDF